MAMAKAKKNSRAPEGPSVESLTHRLARCPREFLLTPRTGKSGKIHVAAVVSDLMGDVFGKPPDREALGVFEDAKIKDGNWLNTVLVACWLLSDAWFKGKTELAAPALTLLRNGLGPLSGVVQADALVLEPDRREELARLCLRALGLRPPGETQKAADDRLNALDSVERHRVMMEAKKAEEHARKVREAMAKKKAREAAAKVMRE
jgi:hypothetical protein